MTQVGATPVSATTATVVVVIGGGNLSLRARAVAALLDPGALVIAADSGLDHAVEAGLVPTVLVGDLDSLSAAGRMWAYAHDVRIEEHPSDKDATDTELALTEAAASSATRLLVLGGPGDRLDHTLGTIVALGGPALARFTDVHAVLGSTALVVLHPGHDRTLDDTVTGGADFDAGTFSLVALHGRCTGVHVPGARWPLVDAVLEPAATLGISNETVAATATTSTTPQPTHISVADGVLTVVIP